MSSVGRAKLEKDLDGQLADAAAVVTLDKAKGAAANVDAVLVNGDAIVEVTIHRIGAGELSVIEGVEELRPELGRHGLSDFDIFKER